MKKQFITRVFLSSLVLALTSLFGGGSLLAQEVTEVFYESFNKCAGTGANDNQWSSSSNTSVSADNVGWTFVKGFAAKECAKFGSSKESGSATTPALKFEGDATLTFKAGAWKGDKTTLKISILNGGSLSATTVTMKSGGWSEYEIAITGATINSQIKFYQESKARFFLDEVKITRASSSDPGNTRKNPELAYGVREYNATIGQDNAFPALIHADGVTGITYSSSEESVATVDETGNVTLMGIEGKTTITASISGSGTWKDATASYILNVSKPTSDNSALTYAYKKVTDTNDLMDGGQYIIVCEDQNLAKGPGKETTSVEVSITNGMIIPTESAELGVYTLEAMTGGYALKYGEKQYLSVANSGTALNVSKTPVAWTVTIGSDGNTFIQCSKTTSRQILASNSNMTSIAFKNYASSLVGSSSYYNIQLYQKVDVYHLTVSSATGGYATFYNEEEAYQMPAGLTGYAVSKAEAGDYITRTSAYEAGATVPAKTPLLIIGTAGDYYPAVVSGTGVDPYTGDNLLKGTRDANGFTQSANEDVYYYKLGLNREGKLGFYWGAADGAAFQMKKATTAYLAIPQSMANGANALFFDFGGETGINEIQTEQADKAIFDLSGRRVQKATKGFYIVGGKKVLVK